MTFCYQLILSLQTEDELRKSFSFTCTYVTSHPKKYGNFAGRNTNLWLYQSGPLLLPATEWWRFYWPHVTSCITRFLRVQTIYFMDTIVLVEGMYASRRIIQVHTCVTQIGLVVNAREMEFTGREKVRKDDSLPKPVWPCSIALLPVFLGNFIWNIFLKGTKYIIFHLQFIQNTYFCKILNKSGLWNKWIIRLGI